MHDIMKTKFETRLRVLALTKGLKLIRIQSQSNMETGSHLYRLISESGVTIFPTGKDVNGAPLREAENWLMSPS